MFFLTKGNICFINLSIILWQGRPTYKFLMFLIFSYLLIFFPVFSLVFSLLLTVKNLVQYKLAKFTRDGWCMYSIKVENWENSAGISEYSPVFAYPRVGTFSIFCIGILKFDKLLFRFIIIIKKYSLSVADFNAGTNFNIIKSLIMYSFLSLNSLLYSASILTSP
jgi:hypothetical protein